MWRGDWDWMPRVSSALSFKVSVAMQNKSMDSMYSMGIEIWKLIRCSLSTVSFGTRKAAEGPYSV